MDAPPHRSVPRASFCDRAIAVDAASGRSGLVGAEAAVLAWAWQATELTAVLAHTTAANTGSLRVMERSGMQRQGVFLAAAQGRPGLALELTVYRAERPR